MCNFLGFSAKCFAIFVKFYKVVCWINIINFTQKSSFYMNLFKISAEVLNFGGNIDFKLKFSRLFGKLLFEFWQMFEQKPDC